MNEISAHTYTPSVSQAGANKNTLSTSPATVSGQPDSAGATTENSQVTLSKEGKALLHALQQIEKQTPHQPESMGEKVESFAHGALGLDPPDQPKAVTDKSYSAGKYFSAAMTIGGILLALA